MEACTLGLALAAFVIAVVALVRTARPRAHFTPLRPAEGAMGEAATDDAEGAGADRPGHPIRSLQLIRCSQRRASSTVATQWLLRVIPRACAVTAVTIVVATFAYQNSRVVRLDFLDWRLERVPVAAAILAAAIVPAATVATLAFVERRRLRVAIRRLEHRVREAGDSRRRPARYTRLQPTLGSRLARYRRLERLGKP